MTVDEMLDRMSNTEFEEWREFYRIEPFGIQMENHRWGIMASMYANAHRDPRKAAWKPDDFFPQDYLKKEPKELSQDELKSGQQMIIDQLKTMFEKKKKERKPDV